MEKSQNVETKSAFTPLYIYIYIYIIYILFEKKKSKIIDYYFLKL